MADEYISVVTNDAEDLATVQAEKAKVKREIESLQAQLKAVLQQLDELAEQENAGPGTNNEKLREVKQVFANKAAKGIELALETEVIPEETPEAVAQFLLSTPGLDKQQIGNFLGEPDEFNLQVLSAFAKLQDFKGIAFDAALRRFLWCFRLPGESQKIDRMMESFAEQYHACNPDRFQLADTAYVLAFATIMLNTSLHNANIKDRMTVEQFVSMNRGIDSGNDLPTELLEEIYNSIRSEQFQMPDEGKGLDVFVNSEKTGWLTKEGGRNKSWKKRWFILSNSCLYYFENPEAVTPKGTIPLENLTVSIDTRRPFCFQIAPPLEEDGQGNAKAGNVKAAKVKSGKLVQGKHSSYRICAADKDSMESWMQAIRAAMTKDPLAELYSSKKQRVKTSAGLD
eukprot:TRINITY_DN12369_c0_g1_i1.p1 TRINITY_DN12369_c0_g1~~TRINITY_DN12369_c0_g1_i1.p1  ORF type:complete len:398 (+),score=126.89 TRINITY_DN12369_c0_g1_i1:110-1303(+)